MFGLFNKRNKGKPDSPSEPQPALPQIVPRIKTLAFLEALKPALANIERMGGDAAAQTPVSQPLAGDLLVTYSLDTPTQFISVNYDTMKKCGLDPVSLHGVAMRSLRAVYDSKGITLQDLAVYKAIVLGDDLEACALLLPELWNSLASSFKGVPIVVVPSRNAVYLMDSRAEVATGGKTFGADVILNLMCSAAAKARDAAHTHGLSENVFAWVKEKWEVRGTLGNHANALE
jgi:hypothetical protein